MKRILTFSLILLSNNIFAQKIESFTFSECDDSCDMERVVNRIAYSDYRDNILTIEFGTISNCAGMFNPTAKFSKDTLWITYEDFITRIEYDEEGNKVHIEEVIMCDCYFISEYEISGLPNRAEVVLLNGEVMNYYPDMYKLYPVTFEILEGDTINYTDKYGFEQGKWVIDFPNGGYSIGYQEDGVYVWLERKTYFSNGDLRSDYSKDSLGRGFGKTYDENQNVYSHLTETGAFRSSHTWYYPSGNVKRQYIVTDNSTCEIEFYEDGQLMKISAPGIWNEYYQSGQIKEHRLYNKSPQNIWAIYYYENGEYLAVHYIKETNLTTSDSWWEYFDPEGSSTTKEYIKENGYEWIFK